MEIVPQLFRALFNFPCFCAKVNLSVLVTKAKATFAQQTS